jgi:hypothetical protein
MPDWLWDVMLWAGSALMGVGTTAIAYTYKLYNDYRKVQAALASTVTRADNTETRLQTQIAQMAINKAVMATLTERLVDCSEAMREEGALNFVARQSWESWIVHPLDGPPLSFDAFRLQCKEMLEKQRAYSKAVEQTND